jgi:hypothetical protein
VLPEDHPAYEALSIASISRITTSDFMEGLTARWFPGKDTEKEGGATADDNAVVQVEWRFVAACAIASICVTLGTIFHWHHSGWRTIKARADIDEVPADTHEYCDMRYLWPPLTATFRFLKCEFCM